MNLIKRITNILVAPKKEWEVIEREDTPISSLVMSYLLILALIPAIATFIGYGIVGYKVPFFGYVGGSISFGIKHAIISLLSNIGGAFLTAFVINTLAPSFLATPDLRKAMQLTVYSFTPSLLAGILMISPALGTLAFFAGLYGLYMLYTGLQPLMKVPAEKTTTYFVVSLLVMILSSLVIGMILSVIIIGSATRPF